MKRSRDEASDRDANMTSTTVRITDQFWERDAMMYDLKSGTVRLTIRMHEQTGGWEVQAFPKQTQAREPLTATAPKRSDALGLIAEQWNASSSFPSLDWRAICAALTAVRAL